MTREDGTYELTYTYNKKGARVGSHVVHITTERPAVSGEDGEPAKPARKEFLPDRYHNRTELTGTVKAGRNEINFDLSSKKK